MGSWVWAGELGSWRWEDHDDAATCMSVSTEDDPRCSFAVLLLDELSPARVVEVWSRPGHFTGALLPVYCQGRLALT